LENHPDATQSLQSECACGSDAHVLNLTSTVRPSNCQGVNPVKMPTMPPVAGTSAYEKPNLSGHTHSDNQRCAREGASDQLEKKHHARLPVSSSCGLCAGGPPSLQLRTDKHPAQEDRGESFLPRIIRLRPRSICRCQPLISRSPTDANQLLMIMLIQHVCMHARGDRSDVRPPSP